MWIAESDREKLRARFADELAGDTRIVLATHEGECPMCARADELLSEIDALSQRVSLTKEHGSGALPEIRLEGGARGQVRFLGLPSGYEFPTFIDSIIDVGRGQTSLSAEALTRLGRLNERVQLQVFTTPT